jgi:DNA invertase Pin-like site-specific DNA recombinase
MPQSIRAALYARVSTNEQNTKAQELELKAYAKQRGWTVIRVYADRGISGAKDNRPALLELMSDCRRRKVDVVLVWKFDRFARSLKHLVTALEEFKRLGIDFISATEGIDTTIPSGELVFQIFGAIAQFERTLISERVRSGLASARKQGKRLGRPAIRELNQTEIKKVRADRASGKFSLRELASKYATSVWAVQTAIASRNRAL